jgi:hypothetical protein
MSDELIENDTPPTTVTKPKLNIASIIAILLILGVVGFSSYIYSFWFTHNSRTARLKARNGDFVQLQRRADDDEFAPAPPRNRNRGNDSGSENKEGDSTEVSKVAKEPNAVEKFIKDMMPLPIQIVYWKEPKLQAEDIDLILEFQDLEVLSVKCEQIDAKSIERFLNLPRIRRVSVQSKSIDTTGIESWSANEKLVDLRLINTSWSDEEIQDVSDKAKQNPKLKKKMTVTSSDGPSMGGM